MSGLVIFISFSALTVFWGVIGKIQPVRILLLLFSLVFFWMTRVSLLQLRMIAQQGIVCACDVCSPGAGLTRYMQCMDKLRRAVQYLTVNNPNSSQLSHVVSICFVAYCMVHINFKVLNSGVFLRTVISPTGWWKVIFFGHGV